MVTLTPWPLYSGECVAGTHRMGGWVCPRAGLDAVTKRKKYLTASAENRSPAV